MTSHQSPEGLHALVFGASGISGWALMSTCLTYPTTRTFSRIIGLTHRPLDPKDALLPMEEQKRWELHSGFDLSRGVDPVKEKLGRIGGLEEVTHVFFASYVGNGSDYQELKRANVEILENAVLAVEALCPKLRFWTLQTGGKAYGVEFAQHVPYNPPLSESVHRIPEPYASNIFYYAQYDLLSRLAKSKPWSFNEIRPDAIVGFVPNHNAMNLAQCLALFLSFYAWKEGKGAEVVFPGSEKAWEAKHSDTHQDILAKFHIWSALHPEQVQGKAFNVADGEIVTWADVWPGICAWFGLKGVGPTTTSSQELGGSYVSAHQSLWSEFEKSNGLRDGAMAATGWWFMDAIMTKIEFDRQYDLSRSREVGFEEKIDTTDGYVLSFERMRKGGVIP